MRFRYLNIVLICGLVFSVVTVYGLKYRAQLIAKENASLIRQIQREKVVMSALGAKWALVNQPRLVEAIVVRNSEALKLAPIDAHQFVSLENIPMRPSTPNVQFLGDLLGGLLTLEEADEGEITSADIGLINALIEENGQ